MTAKQRTGVSWPARGRRTPLEEQLANCPCCGETNAPIGRLGRLLHFTCRACGIWYSRED